MGHPGSSRPTCQPAFSTRFEGVEAVGLREGPVPAVASSSPLSVLAAAADLPHGLSEVETITLVVALGAVPDSRKARGRRYWLQAILMLAMTGVMAGARSWTALAQWARDGQHKVSLCRPRPSLWTFRRVLSTVDVAAVEAVLSAWVLGRRRAAACAGVSGPRAAERVVLPAMGRSGAGHGRRPAR